MAYINGNEVLFSAQITQLSVMVEIKDGILYLTLGDKNV